MILEPLIETETDYAALGMNFDPSFHVNIFSGFFFKIKKKLFENQINELYLNRHNNGC